MSMLMVCSQCLFTFSKFIIKVRGPIVLKFHLKNIRLWKGCIMFLAGLDWNSGCHWQHKDPIDGNKL